MIDTKKFLNTLFPDLDNEYIEVRVLSGPKVLAQKYFTSVDDLVAEIPAFNKLSGGNVYVGVCPRREKQGKRESVSRIRSLWVDLDVKNFPGGKEEILKRLKEFPLPPTMIIDSGYGIHAYFVLRESETDKDLVESYLKSLASVLYADPACCDAPRVMRLVGTFNRKNPDNPLPVKIISLDESTTYNLSDFDFILQTDATGGEQVANTKNPKDWIVEVLSSLQDGNRNANFSKIIGRLIHDRYSIDEIFALLLPHAEKCRFDEKELKSEIKKMFKSYAEQDFISQSSSEDSGNKWPDPLKPEAYHGLVGEIVRLIEPHSEADPVALLAQLIVSIGNMIGRQAHLSVEANRHYLNLFVVIVGASSRARKGTAWGHVNAITERIDNEWARNRIKQGASSGEGIIWNIRNPIFKLIKKKDGYEDIMVDKGVDDKRLLVVEEEFSSPLKVMQREGNILSPILRSAWDKGDLESLTKNAPISATGGHVSIIGHITKDELLRCFDKTEAANGFGNRFLWPCARRSKVLPDGGRVPEETLMPLLFRLIEAVNFAKTIYQIKRDEEASRFWHEIYPDLTRDTPGLLGAVISRAEAQVSRLSCFYALMDKSPVVKVEHLKAALAFWEYAEQSARYIFGDRLGYPEADEILQALRASAQGLTRTQIQQLFHRNKTAEQIHKALEFLLRNHFVERTTQETDGRPAERWTVRRVGSYDTKKTK